MKLSWQLDVLPKQIRQGLAAGARLFPARLGPIPVRGRRFAQKLASPRAERLLSALGSYKGNARWVLSRGLSQTLGSSVFSDGVASLADHEGSNDAATVTIAAYIRGYLQEDILVKVDRASMAVSLEVRAPFLDSRVIDFLCNIPPDLKLKGMTGKYL